MSSQTFTMFLDLPYELRSLIWTYAALTPRTVKISKYSMDGSPPQTANSTRPDRPDPFSEDTKAQTWTCEVHSSIPPLLITCNESSLIAKKFYVKRFHLNFRYPVWFNNQRDVLWFEDTKALDEFMCYWQFQDPDMGWGLLRYIALPVPWKMGIESGNGGGEAHSDERITVLEREGMSLCCSLLYKCTSLRKVWFLKEGGVDDDEQVIYCSAREGFKKVVDNCNERWMHRPWRWKLKDGDLPDVEYGSRVLLEERLYPEVEVWVRNRQMS